MIDIFELFFGVYFIDDCVFYRILDWKNIKFEIIYLCCLGYF